MPTKGPNPTHLVKCDCGWDVKVTFKPAKCNYTKHTNYKCLCGQEYTIIDYFNGMTTYLKGM